MKKQILILLFIIFLIPLGFGCTHQHHDNSIAHYTCPMHPQIHEENPGQCPICGMDLVPVKKETTEGTLPVATSTSQVLHNSHEVQQQMYTCPMHPEIMQDKPGQCPVCKMNLVPVETEKKNPENAIKINPEYQQYIGVKTQKVLQRDLVKTINTHGKVAHDAKLWVAQNEYVQALKLGDQSLIKSSELKLEYMGLSKEWINSIKNKKEADISLHLEQKQGPTFFEAYVYQNDIDLIHQGQTVAIMDQKGRYLDTGKVKAISTMANLDTRSIRVLIESSKNLNMRLNTFVQFEIKIPLGLKLSIPKESILFNGNHNMVYIKIDPGHFVPKVVSLGEQADAFYEVLDGLTEGQDVVTNGTFLIDSESQIKMGGMSQHKH